MQTWLDYFYVTRLDLLHLSFRWADFIKEIDGEDVTGYTAGKRELVLYTPTEYRKYGFDLDGNPEFLVGRAIVPLSPKRVWVFLVNGEVDLISEDPDSVYSHANDLLQAGYSVRVEQFDSWAAAEAYADRINAAD